MEGIRKVVRISFFFKYGGPKKDKERNKKIQGT
jgi:hypothetical protein